MKIEVGDIVNTAHHKNVVIEKIDTNRFTPVVYFYSKEQEATVGAWLSNCTLVKKGEKEMEEVNFKAIEAYKLMEKGSIMKGDNGVLYRVVDGTLHSKCGSDSDWTGSCVLAEVFFKMKFTEYKEPLKYKVGDEVWVKATVTDVHDDDIRGYKLKTSSAYKVHVKEQDVKGIDE